MFFRFLNRVLLVLACIAMLTSLGRPYQALAQFYDSQQDEEGIPPEDQQFVQPGEDQFVVPGPEDQFTEGDKYVEESRLAPSERALSEGGVAGIQLAGQKQQFPLNIAWGAGTGLLIGGWLALLKEGNNRETQRSIGMGIVLGIFLGATVGLRTLINPNLPQTAARTDPPAHGISAFAPVVALKATGPQIGFRLKF